MFSGYSVMVTIVDPPNSMATIHQRVLDGLEHRGVHLQDGSKGPCLVTVVNSSRIDSDMTRDLGKAKGRGGM